MSLSGDSGGCSATTKAGEPCKNRAIKGTDRCSSHSGRVGAPKGNRNRRTHGFYARPARPLGTIDDVVEDLMEKQSQLSAYIEGQLVEGEADLEGMAKLLALHGQNASRVGRLLRDQRALSGDSADGLSEAIGKALDEIGSELGIVV